MHRSDRDRFGANTRKGFHVEVPSSRSPAQPFSPWHCDAEEHKAVMVPKSVSEKALSLPAYSVSTQTHLLGFLDAIDPISHLNLNSRDTHALGERQSPCHP